MKIIREFILREIAGETVLVPTGDTTNDFNGLITLSETARFIWENLEQAENFDALVNSITDNYEIDRETAARDAAEFLVRLLRMGFIALTKEDHTW